jgi:amino-acid N-acetyltransferase
MPSVMEAVGAVRVQVEALLSMGLANSPMAGARIRVASGNFVTARPLGVRDGTDYGLTGEVRRIDTEAITQRLDSGAIVLVSPLGYSPTGEVFNVTALEVATAVASTLHADKLLCLSETRGVKDSRKKLMRQIGMADVAAILQGKARLSPDDRAHLEAAFTACQNKVRRVHLIDRHVDGGLLLELFTRDGIGTLVSADVYEGTRQATIEDVGGILELIKPLEEDGILVRRSREQLELDIGRFNVIDRDGTIIGCAAFFPYPEENTGELACLAVRPDYQKGGRGDALLQYTEAHARHLGIGSIFVLTTRAIQWFQERGFAVKDKSYLPGQRQALYNLQRNSKVLVKNL